jgi:hypothetical protein
MSTSGEEIALGEQAHRQGAEMRVEVVERAAGRIREGATAVTRIAEQARSAA